MTSRIRPILVIAWCVLAAPAWAGFDKEATRDMLVCLHSTNTADGLDFDRLQKAIATGADVNTTERVEGQTQTPLAKAVALKHLDAVLAMLRAGADLNSHASDGPLRSPDQSLRLTPLMYAVFPSFDGRLMGGFLGSLCGEQFPGSVGLVQLLAKHGAELNARDALGRTALMMAALSAQPKLVEELLILGADPAIRDGDGRTALELTPDVYQARIADGAPNPTVAVAREIKTILRFYQEEPEFRATLGAATPVPLPVSRIIGDYLFGGRGPAQAAVEEPKQALPREERKDAAPLEERKAPAVDAKALDQALAAAVQRLEVKEAAALLAQGADVNVRLGAGRTPLILAAMEGHASLARLLLKQDGVEFDHQDSGGRSALMHAALADKPELVIQLLDKGADINLLDGDQQTAYDLAFGRPTILHLIEERQNRKVGEEVD